jgi:hypothetical protein
MHVEIAVDLLRPKAGELVSLFPKHLVSCAQLSTVLQ